MRERRPILLDTGGVLASWLVLLAIENLVIGIGHRDEFAGSWEMAHARWYLTPLALGASFPLAVGAVLVGRLVAAGRVRTLAAIGAVAGALVAQGVSTGRHMASLGMRVPFVAFVAAAGAAIAYAVGKRARTAPPWLVASLGAGVACVAWIADARVLPRLYPAFHLALLVVTLGGWASTWLVVRGARARATVATLALAITLLSLAGTQRAANAVRGDDNLRRVLLEHAPLLGRSVILATRLSPPPPLDDGSDTEATSAAIKVGGATHALDWRSKDIVLLTIDALRADHVSSYGYARATTPNIDRLAARGARFTHAYCPTPHTSYSITSLMTGKYMRPLLAMGAGEDSETWAGYLRRYGYRTAAFYPPAVFFIDQHRFQKLEADGLGFEYRKVEFAKPALRKEQIGSYLASAPVDKPLFLWVHLFEPHEPYEMHPEHPFSGDERTDAYDSEIAAADALVGDVVELVERRRPGAVVVVSADHGEELGDHGGRYHGTTVYEEQVRVPLVVVAPSVSPRVIATPVQTIDLLPTALSALDIPLPARIRGRDLGGLLAGAPAGAKDDGLAFAETDDFTLVARGGDRLVCARKIASCTLFDVASDPAQKHPVTDRPDREKELRRMTAAIERENGKLEASALPDALRRGLQGDRDAAEDVAPLLDDARVEIRRAAARCGFRLRAPEMVPALRRALGKDEDAEVATWSALALHRMGEDAPAAKIDAALRRGDPAARVAAALALRRGDPAARVAAALALAERGDARGEGELTLRWEAAFAPGARDQGELDEAREILAALGKLRSKSATPALARSLEDVRLRPFVVEALGAIGDPKAKDALLAAFAAERYVHLRGTEARVLLALGAGEEARAPLARFAGVPEPMPEALELAARGKLLDPAHGGASWVPPRSEVELTLRLGGTGPARLYATPAEGLDVRVEGAARSVTRHGDVAVAEIPDAPSGSLRVRLAQPTGVHAIWIVRRAPEIPPPPPREWDAGAPP